jgi:hypothetical protein
MQAAWEGWTPPASAAPTAPQGELVFRAEPDRSALMSLPGRLYIVWDRHLQVVGKDALVSFESWYSVLWVLVPTRQRVGLRVTLRRKIPTLSWWATRVMMSWRSLLRASTVSAIIPDRSFLQPGADPRSQAQTIPSNPYKA